eukprot:gene3727-3644_t
MTFATLGLIEPLLRSLETLGYQTPTPVQAQAIPAVLAGRDLMAAAQTGTGKTAGFALPLLQLLAMEGPKVTANSVRALILVPTRELAEQVHEAVRQYAENLPLRTYAVYGGVSINPQMMKLIEVSPRNVAANTVKQWIVTVDKKRKPELFVHLMRKGKWKQVLVFAKTRNGVDALVEKLQGLGINADGIHGDKPQATRQRALDRFKLSEVQILVATDVAARGLDIEDLPLVVNFDLPIVAEDYIHRIGRTGRAGSTGEAISLVCADEVNLLSAIEMLTRQTLKRQNEPDFEPEHRVPDTDASGQVIKKPKKPKKPKTSGGGGKRNLGKWVDSGEAAPPEPSIKPVRKVPVFNTGPRKRKP